MSDRNDIARQGRGGYLGGLFGSVVGGLLWAVITAFVIGEPLWALIPGGAIVAALLVGLLGYSGDFRRDLRRLGVICGAIVALDVVLVWWWYPLLPTEYQNVDPLLLTVTLAATGLFVVVRLWTVKEPPSQA